MYKINGLKSERMEPVTFSELNLTENDIEEILRNSIDMICDEEESMLIVGKQVRNVMNGRSDLTAVDNNGDIVLIEIKRDLKDIINRKEAFEFQAIRYAASYATIKDTEDLVSRVYAPYIDKYRSEFESAELTSFELGVRKLDEFLKENNAHKDFNEKQKVILVASDFDEQTLSAVAWLNSNGVDMSCYKLVPYRLDNNTYFYVDKLLPVTDYDYYYVNIIENTNVSSKTSKQKVARRRLPRIDSMIEWGVVNPGDVILPKGKDGEGILTENGNVIVDGEEKSMQEWLKEVYGWSSVATYYFAIHQESNKSLSEIRENYMEANKEILTKP